MIAFGAQQNREHNDECVIHIVYLQLIDEEAQQQRQIDATESIKTESVELNPTSREKSIQFEQLYGPSDLQDDEFINKPGDQFLGKFPVHAIHQAGAFTERAVLESFGCNGDRHHSDREALSD